jgi:hypothetical protein
MLTLNDGRSELWQWDTKRKLTVDAECSQVHFSNKVFGRSTDMPVVDGVAEIPDFLLQADKDLTAWAFVGTAENGYTKISKVFKVNKRNKPADYVFTPPEQTTLEEIMERLDDLESMQDPDAIKNAVEDYMEQNPISGGGISATAANLLIEILESAVYSANVTGKIQSLKAALTPGGGGGDTPDIPDTPDDPDEPVITDHITVTDGVMTIVSVGSAITVSDGVMAIA